MKFTTLTTAASLTLASLFTNAVAAPAHLQTRDVFVPPILYPKGDTVWKIGETHSVVWDTKGAPVNITNKVGRIFLRKNDRTTPASLCYRVKDANPLILGNNFDILDGRVQVKVPWVVDGSDYEVVLFGDSGNFSPKFKIYGAGIEF